MRCPYCDLDEDRVIDSRSAHDGRAVRRRRTCLACGQRFSTYERVEQAPLRVRKRDGDLEPFDSEKVAAGMAEATKNLPLEPGAVRRAVARVEGRLREAHRREVDSETIGAAVLEALRDLHEVAYLRFASVYKSFTGTEDFQRELAALEEAAALSHRAAADERPDRPVAGAPGVDGG